MHGRLAERVLNAGRCGIGSNEKLNDIGCGSPLGRYVNGISAGGVAALEARGEVVRE